MIQSKPFYLQISQHPRAFFFFFFLIVFPNIHAEQKPRAPEFIQGVKIVTADEVVNMILDQPDLIVIDSRKKAEYQNGHIEGSINLPNTKLNHEDIEKIAPDKSQVILFYCNGIRCLRSSDSIYKVKAWGYSNLVWGLTASDNPWGYNAHSPTNDNGTITPTAAISAMPYIPESR